MVQKLTGIIFLLLLLAGCGEDTPTKKPDKTPVPPASVFQEAEYHFCGADTPDRFLAGYFGEKATESDVHFFVVCHSGDTLFATSWPSQDLLADSLRGAVDDQTAETLIQKRIEAIVLNNPPKLVRDTIPGFGPVAADLKDRLENLGAERVFTFRLGGKKPFMIAWSGQEGKIVAM